MPIYDYRCEDCRSTYDVLHLGREVLEDVRCPRCGSARHRKLVSAPAKAVVSEGGGSCGSGGCGIGPAPGGCAGGACGL